jgi:predicted DsbA family dithiol-disulfide isomerase
MLAIPDAPSGDRGEYGKDIGDIDYLVGLAASLGIDEAEARAALSSERFAADVRADIAEARRLGITGVPFFVIDRTYGISGAQPTDVFVEALTEAWTP